MQGGGVFSREKSSGKYVGDFRVEFTRRGYYNILVLFLFTLHFYAVVITIITITQNFVQCYISSAKIFGMY